MKIANPIYDVSVIEKRDSEILTLIVKVMERSVCGITKFNADYLALSNNLLTHTHTHTHTL